MIVNSYWKYFQDIRSFFSVLSKKTSVGSSSKPIRKKAVVIDSDDDDDVIKPTPEKNIKVVSKNSSKRKVQVISSDSEDEKPKKKSPLKNTKGNEPKLIPITVDEYFGDRIAKMSKVVTPPKEEPKEVVQKKSNKKKRKNPEIGIHVDKDFQKTLEELDDDDFMNSIDVLEKTFEEATQKIYKDKDDKNKKEGSSKENSPNKVNGKEIFTIKNASDKKESPEVSKTDKKRQRNDSEGNTSICLLVCFERYFC